jgi:hypothetical protein
MKINSDTREGLRFGFVLILVLSAIFIGGAPLIYYLSKWWHFWLGDMIR